jgi:hypothetical protein
VQGEVGLVPYPACWLISWVRKGNVHHVLQSQKHDANAAHRDRLQEAMTKACEGVAEHTSTLRSRPYSSSLPPSLPSFLPSTPALPTKTHTKKGLFHA